MSYLQEKSQVFLRKLAEYEAGNCSRAEFATWFTDELWQSFKNGTKQKETADAKVSQSV
jgi:hypothetical protein